MSFVTSTIICTPSTNRVDFHVDDDISGYQNVLTLRTNLHVPVNTKQIFITGIRVSYMFPSDVNSVTFDEVALSNLPYMFHLRLNGANEHSQLNQCRTILSPAYQQGIKQEDVLNVFNITSMYSTLMCVSSSTLLKDSKEHGMICYDMKRNGFIFEGNVRYATELPMEVMFTDYKGQRITSSSISTKRFIPSVEMEFTMYR